MATNMNNAGSLLLPEIGPDGIARESPVIAYTEKVIEQEQLQLRNIFYARCGYVQPLSCNLKGPSNCDVCLWTKKILFHQSGWGIHFHFSCTTFFWNLSIRYIEENYSKIRDVERELANLNMEMKLTSGPKKAALEHMRKKIEMSTERVRVAKLKEEQAKMVWEAAAKTVQDEEAMKQKLCEDLNNLVQESSNAQFTRLEELKRRLEALNPSRSSTHVSHDGNHAPAQIITTQAGSAVPVTSEPISGSEGSTSNKDFAGNSHVSVQNQQPSSDVEGRGKKKGTVQGRVRGIGAIQKGRGPAAPGWTGAGFDVDGRG